MLTAMGTVPLELKSADETGIETCEELTIDACLAIPFQVTVELERKFDPVIVKAKPFVPAAALVGEIDWTAGTGFSAGGGGGVEPPPHEQNNTADTQHIRAYVTRLNGPICLPEVTLPIVGIYHVFGFGQSPQRCVRARCPR